jgi:hypothetical protein
VLRPRIDCGFYPGGRQESAAGGVRQRLDTRVETLAIGSDLLAAVPGNRSKLNLGIGIQEIRWSVTSRNTVGDAQGLAAGFSGTARWWRFGWGPVASWRFSDHLELEGRYGVSRYGQENQAANALAASLLWTF